MVDISTFIVCHSSSIVVRAISLDNSLESMLDFCVRILTTIVCIMGSKTDSTFVNNEVFTLPSHTAEKQGPDGKEASKKKATLRDIIHEYGEVSTAHGIPRIISSERWWAKLFWFIVSCGLAVLFGYQGYGLLKDYFLWPYNTKIDVISKSKVDFPAVTVCNLNRLRKSELIGTRYQGIIDIENDVLCFISGINCHNESSALFLLLDWYNYTEYDIDNNSSWSNLSEYFNVNDWDDMNTSDILSKREWAEFYVKSKNDDYSDIAKILNPTREELKQFGHQAEDFILQCTFDERRCTYTDFRQFQNNLYGNCYTFNHGFDKETVRSTSKSGAQYGLHLTLFIEQPEYVGIFSPESGVRVSVHPSHVQPFPEDEGITASTGMATSIGIRQTRIRRLGGKYTKPYCTKDGFDMIHRHHEHHIHHAFAYTSLTCRKFCLQEELYVKCDCVSDILIEAPKCSFVNETQKQCWDQFEKLSKDDKIECDCPEVCDEIIYPTSVSSALWPSDHYESHLYRRLADRSDEAASTLLDLEKSRKNLVRLRIFYEELNFQEIKQQKAWSIESISGAVGGLMGLYLGFSAVSILEIIILLLKVLVYFGTRWCR